MAYSQRRGNFVGKGKPQSNQGGQGKRKDYAFSTGLFAPKKDGVKRVAEVFMKEELVIPAGSYLHLYEGDKVEENGIVFRLALSTPE